MPTIHTHIHVILLGYERVGACSSAAQLNSTIVRAVLQPAIHHAKVDEVVVPSCLQGLGKEELQPRHLG